MEAALAVARLFGFEPTGASEIVGAGTLNWNYRVETATGPIFVRKHRPERSREHIEQEHAFVAYAADRNIPAPLPLHTPDGDTVVKHAGGAWAAYPWVDATPPSRGQMSERQAWALGEMHGRIHAAVLDYPESIEVAPPRPLDVARSTTDLEHVLRAARTANAEDWIIEGLSFQLDQLRAHGANTSEAGLTRSPSHGDYHDQQLLYAGETVAAVTDWELFGMRPRVWELVRSMAFSQILEGPHMATHIAGYREHMPLPEPECRLALELWWQSRLHGAWVFQAYFLQGNQRVAEFFLETLRALRALANPTYRRDLTERFVHAATAESTTPGVAALRGRARANVPDHPSARTTTSPLAPWQWGTWFPEYSEDGGLVPARHEMATDSPRILPNRTANGFPSPGTIGRMKAHFASVIVLLIATLVAACGDQDSGEKWPGPVSPLAPAPFISAGWDHACAIRDDGTVACWGSNEEMDCPPWSDSPCFTHYWGQAVAPEGRFVALAAGTFHTCGVREDGTIDCWGANESFGCLPFGPCTVYYEGQSTPPAGAFQIVSAGYTHSCGVRADWTVACWGANDSGQSSPPAGQFQSVVAGSSHTCGLRLTGEVECWGLNWSGQADAPDGVFASISAGSAYTCGLRTDGRLECWGSNTGGETVPPAGVFKMVTTGSMHACGIRPDDTVECWGFNYTSGSVVNGHFLSEHQIPPGPFLTITAGYVRTCGIRPDAAVACWGAWAGSSDVPLGAFKTE